MNRTLQALFLVFAILWQSMAMLSPMFIQKLAATLEHTVLHDQVATHHHHSDLSAHIEDAAEGFQHLHVDNGLQTLGLTPMTAVVFPALPPLAPLTYPIKLGASPLLDGLLRPPRLLA